MSKQILEVLDDNSLIMKEEYVFSFPEFPIILYQWILLYSIRIIIYIIAVVCIYICITLFT